MFSRLSQHFSCCHSFPIKPSSCFLDFRCLSPRTSGGPAFFDWAATHQSFTVPSCSPQKGLKSLGLESNWLCLKLGKPQTWWFLIMFIDVHWCSFKFIQFPLENCCRHFGVSPQFETTPQVETSSNQCHCPPPVTWLWNFHVKIRSMDSISKPQKKTLLSHDYTC